MKLNITKKLKAYMVDEHGMAADATDEQVKSAVITALEKDDSDLTPEKLVGLTAPEQTEEEKAKKAESKLDQMIESKMAKMADGIAAKLSETIAGKVHGDDPGEEPEGKEKGKTPNADGPDPKEVYKEAAEHQEKANTPNGHIRIKPETEKMGYRTTKTALVYDQDKGGRRAGEPIIHRRSYSSFSGSGLSIPSASDSTVDVPSEAEYAKCGAWSKMRMAQAAGMPLKSALSEHDRNLILESLENDRFSGMDYDKSAEPRRMRQDEISRFKAVLDDSSSGGEEAVPEYFDDAIIQTPLLHGELFPFVEVVNVPRGSSADGISIGTPTFVTTASGSAITPFSTTSFVSAFDTTFYPASVGFEWGLDFEADATPGFGQAVTNQIGQESLRWLDEQIAVGDGTSEPQGLFIGTTTSVSSEGGTFSSLTYNEVLNIAFGINKAHRNAFGGNATRFVMNDSQYKELMQIATGVTGDTRPIFGMQLKDYMLGDYPVSVQNDISNGNIALVNLRGYRLYRRQGLEFSTHTEGRTLALANKKLLLARMRWGGKMTLSGYVAELSV